MRYPDRMTGFKLLRIRKDGTLGPLFINRNLVLEPGKTYQAEPHRTKGYAFRPGFHICSRKSAPHLSKKGRVWARVSFQDYTSHLRPISQGGLWYTAKVMKILNFCG